MAKTSKNILGDQQGKIGKVVGRVVNGVQLYSALSGGGHDAHTPKQLAQRARFSAISHLACCLSGAIKVGYRRASSGVPLTSARNIFVKRNIQHVTYDMETGVVTTDLEHIVLSDGNVPDVTFASPSFAEAGKVVVTFTPNVDADAGAFSDDDVYAVVYCTDEKAGMMMKAPRSSGSITLNVPSEWTGKDVVVWAFVKTSVSVVTQIDTYGLTLYPYACSKSHHLGSGTIS